MEIFLRCFRESNFIPDSQIKKPPSQKPRKKEVIKPFNVVSMLEVVALILLGRIVNDHHRRREVNQLIGIIGARFRQQ